MPALSKPISSVVRLLDKSPIIQDATVFGSLIDKPERAGGVDVAFIVNEPFSDRALDTYRHLLKAGAHGTPRHGLLDVFLCFKDQVWVRNENCLGFARAKNSRALRADVAQGKPWPQWRSSVSLHAPATIYFAHPISAYNSPIEAQAIQVLERAGFVVVNPSDPVHAEACGSDMTLWTALAGTCDAVAMLGFEDGAIGAGVAKEVATVHGQGKPVFKVAQDGKAFVPLAQWPGDEVILSVDETRARIAPLRKALQEAQALSAPTGAVVGTKSLRP